MVIPIALAISLIFVGFTVYADEAQNFVIRTQEEGDVRLSLTMQEDLSRQTSVLSVPFVGSQTNSSFDPLAPGYEDYLYDSEITTNTTFPTISPSFPVSISALITTSRAPTLHIQLSASGWSTIPNAPSTSTL